MEKIKSTLISIFQKGLFYILTGTFLTKIVSFFGSIFLVRVLSKEDYGILSYLENIYGYVLTLAGMGLSNAILRYVILGKTRQEKYGYYLYARNKGIIYNCFLIIIAGTVSIFHSHPDAYKPYIWMLFILLISLPFQYLTENVLGNERAWMSNKRYALFSLALTISVILGKTVLGRFSGIIGTLYGQMIVYVLWALLLSALTKKKYYKNILADVPDLNKRKEINIYAFQYMITNGLWSVFMLNDTFLLGRYCSPEVLAEYKVAYTIPGSISLFSTSIGIFVVPYFVKNETNKEWIKSNFKKAYFSIGIITGIICLLVLLLSKPIILFLYGQEYINILNIMHILLLASFFNCGLRYTTANILAAMGKIKYNMFISVMGILLQVLINLKFISQYGPIGVAVTSCFVYSVMAISLLIVFYWKVLPKIGT